MTPLSVAALIGYLELVREMLYASADPNTGEAATCGNAAHLALRRLRQAPSLPPVPVHGVTSSRSG